MSLRSPAKLCSRTYFIRSSIFGALVFRTEGLDGIRSLLAGMANPLPVIDEAERVVVRQPDFDCLLEFRT